MEWNFGDPSRVLLGRVSVGTHRVRRGTDIRDMDRRGRGLVSCIVFLTAGRGQGDRQDTNQVSLIGMAMSTPREILGESFTEVEALPHLVEKSSTGQRAKREDLPYGRVFGLR